MDSAGVWQIQAHFLPIFQQICYRPPYTHVRAMVSKMSVPNYNETKDDYSSPTTSTFVNRIPQCRETVNKVEEVSRITSVRT